MNKKNPVVVLMLVLLFTGTISQLTAEELKNGRMKMEFNERSGSTVISYLQQLGGEKYLPLIFNEDPRTTQFSIAVNNQVYNINNSYDFKRSFRIGDNSATYSFESNRLSINQEFSFLTSITSGLADGFAVTFRIRNISSQRLSVGLRYLIDTYLGEDDESHFITDFDGVISQEKEYGASSMPDYILSPYERARDKGLMLMLRSPGVTLPDSLICANWKRLSDSSWGYTVNRSRNFSRPPYSINDSALLLTYNPRQMEPGEERVIVLSGGYFAEGGFSPSLDVRNEKIGNLVASLAETSGEAGSGVRSPEEELATVRELIAQIDELLESGESVSQEKLYLLQQLLDTLKKRQKDFSQ